MRFVLRTDPIHLASKVPLDATIQVYFMIDLQVSCIKPENIILFNLESQASEPISLDYKNKILFIKPISPLQPKQHYQVELVGGENGIKDITGGVLDSSYTFEFYTDNVSTIQPPVFKYPALYASIPELKFQWEAVENAYFYELEISKSNTFNVLVWPLEESRIYDTSITPAVTLEKGIQYYARIRSVNQDGIKSAYSDPIQFLYEPVAVEGAYDHTGSQLDSIQNALGTGNDDSSYLHVIKSTPENLQINVPTSFNVVSNPLQEVSIEFDEEIDPQSIDPTLFYLIAQKN